MRERKREGGEDIYIEKKTKEKRKKKSSLITIVIITRVGYRVHMY